MGRAVTDSINAFVATGSLVFKTGIRGWSPIQKAM